MVSWSAWDQDREINTVNTSLAPGVFKETMGISNLYILYPDKTLHYTTNFNLIPVL